MVIGLVTGGRTVGAVVGMVGKLVGLVGRVGMPFWSHVGHSIGQGVGDGRGTIGLLHLLTYSWGWTQRCSS